MKDVNKEIIKKTLILLLGFSLLALGISAGLNAQIGVSPWDVFHQGVSNITGLKIGQANILVGIVILVLAMSIKVFPGVGTILNILVIGLLIDVVMPIIPVATSFPVGLLMNIFGAVLMALGSCLYLYTKTGAGPRDSFLMGMMQRYHLDTRYVKPVIEGTVMIIGIFLGGNFGVGTFVTLIVMSIMMDVFFKVFRFDPKAEKQMNMKEQYNTMKEVLISEGSNS